MRKFRIKWKKPHNKERVTVRVNLLAERERNNKSSVTSQIHTDRERERRRERDDDVYE